MTTDKSGLFDELTADQTPVHETPAPVQPVANEPAPSTVDPVTKPSEVLPVEPLAAKEMPQVPLPKYLDAYNENRELKRRIADYEAQKTAPRPPDPATDPQGFAQHQSQEFRDQLLTQKIQSSETAARRFYGAQLVREAFTALYAKGDQYVAQQALISEDPAEYTVNWYKREKLLTDIGSDTDAFVRRRYAELDAVNPAATPSATPQATLTPKPVPNVPAPSLSRAPSTGSKPSDTAVTDGFDAAFSR